jgi:hypothetical protein
LPGDNGQTLLPGLLDENLEHADGLRTELAALLEVLFDLVVTAQQDPDQAPPREARDILRVALKMIFTRS